MLPIPPPLLAQFEDQLRRSAVPKENHGTFKKWLRYYLDFCEKYQFPARRKESLPEFLGKLREKRQSKAQQEQAACAIKVFYHISDEKPTSQKPPMGLGGAMPLKTYYEDVKQGYVREASSKPWGVRSASSQALQWAERAFRQEGPHRDRVQQWHGTLPVPMATPTPRGTVGAAEKKRVEKPDVTGAVVSRRTIIGKGASWEGEYVALANEVKVRHYSPKTLHTYTG